MAVSTVCRVSGKPAKPAYRAYVESGYRDGPGARSGASRLLTNDNIKGRIAELIEDTDAEAITPEVIIAGLVKEALKAESDGARVTAWKTLAQVRAMLIQVNEDKTAALSDHELAKMITGYDPEVPEAGGNADLYDRILKHVGAGE